MSGFCAHSDADGRGSLGGAGSRVLVIMPTGDHRRTLSPPQSPHTSVDGAGDVTKDSDRTPQSEQR